MSRNTAIVLTGGPGGGKTTLIEDLLRDTAWSSRIGALPETIFLMGQMGVSPREQLFQKVMVYLQMAIEDGLDRSFEPSDNRIILCHRGSLDPLAYWLDRGWPEEEFFTFSGTSLEEHYQRYAAVIHLVTAADGAEQHYTRWSDAPTVRKKSRMPSASTACSTMSGAAIHSTTAWITKAVTGRPSPGPHAKF